MPYGLNDVQTWMVYLKVHYEGAASGNTEELLGVISAQLLDPEERCLLLAALKEVLAVCEGCADGSKAWPHKQRPDKAPCTCGASGSCARCALARLCTEYTVAIQAAILIGVARICDCEPPPRVKSYYPAVLVNELPALLHGQAANAPTTERQMLELAQRQMRGPLDTLIISMRAVRVGFGKDIPWPAPEVAERVALATCVAEPAWRAVSTQLTANHAALRGEERRHAERLTTVVARAQQTYELLSPPEGGWVRVLLDFKLSILAGAKSWLEHRKAPEVQSTEESPCSSPPASQQQRRRSAWYEIEDVILHEVVMFLLSTLDLYGSVHGDHYLPDARNASHAGRQRLKRARHRVWWSEVSVTEAGKGERPDPDDLEPHCLDTWLRRRSSTICDLFCMNDDLLDTLREVRDRFDEATSPTTPAEPAGPSPGRGSDRDEAPMRCKGN